MKSSDETVVTPSAPRRKRSVLKTIFSVVVYLFALAGAAIIGAWVVYQLGWTNNKGAVDENYRYLMSVSELGTKTEGETEADDRGEQWTRQYLRLAAFSKFYPYNAKQIMHAMEVCDDPSVAERMMAAAAVYTGSNDAYQQLVTDIEERLDRQPRQDHPNVIEWMNTVEWETLKEAIVRDSASLLEAGRLTGVEPRLIVGCLVGEQIRLFNSKRETFKKYLGPVKVLSVQSQFSFGVNGIKDFTASAVEQHLKDPQSEFYMGRRYENILDFQTDNHADERYKRLVDYRSHLYSYLYTGCILHQTMLQWRRAGFDISDRPDILFTLFNVGFSQSKPKAEPRCGGSHIEVDGKTYTFGAIGFDFYYSGELIDLFPFWPERFLPDNGIPVSPEEVQRIQSNISNCHRPSPDASQRTPSAQKQKTSSSKTSDPSGWGRVRPAPGIAY